ncbi:MAG: PTS sugar transporter subunit IIA [Gammaproteobacteria bacterium]|nr:PTS sugar transporter subunit IIA [Gammaproteobacteria bacterium]
MSVAVLIVSHHNIGKALADAIDTSFNHQLPLKLSTVGVPSDADPDKLKLLVKNAIAKLDSGEGVLILTDLYGSTPSNICKDTLETGHVRIVTGLNLPMLLRVMNYPNLSLDEIAANAVSGGQGGIVECRSDDSEKNND